MSAARVPQALSPEQAILSSRLPLVPIEVADPSLREELLTAPRVFYSPRGLRSWTRSLRRRGQGGIPTAFWPARAEYV